eukprot:TRINITY_DN3276_c0_g1_i1.p1 TRINITY_DN3276_c0_g1~~TRINITY_DN3276_c0_g1_i1.p1  ORF type:complete len:341 (+),score=62.78 TRINITY_DN3276_c0_g1_i1:66-1088(+)
MCIRDRRRVHGLQDPMENTQKKQIEIKKAKTHKGKKYLESKEPHLVEKEKKTLFVKGKKTNETVSGFMQDIYVLKKQNSVMLNRRNDLKPFDEQNSLQFLCEKNSCTMFAFGQNSKKRPNNLVVGRLFDGNILDQIELGIESYVPSSQFESLNKLLLNSRPAVVFQGDVFDYDPVFMRVKNLFLDFFVENVHLQKIDAKYGINYAVVFSADTSQKIYMRVYYVNFKQIKQDGDASKENHDQLSEQYELQEVGPRADLVLRRHQIASDDAYKLACKQQPKKSAKFKKNITTTALGHTTGRIYVDQQDLTTLNLKKRKAGKPPAKGDKEQKPKKKVKKSQEE